MDNIIQVAGVKNEKDLTNLIEVNVDYIGFPLFLDYHKPDMSLSETREVSKKYLNQFKPFLITYQSNALDIVAALNYLKFSIVQIHGEIDVAQLKILKETGSLTIIKSLIVNDNFNHLTEIIDTTSSIVDYYITDTFDSKSGASGATGITHDWDISKKIVSYSPKPIILAGGLNPNNIKKAIKYVRPFGVDSHTGLEDQDGMKDLNKVKTFIKRANEAFNSI